jgi:hypothetical protein
MAITNGYLTLKEYKSYFDIKDSKDNSAIERIITAVSRSVDTICWQRFYTTASDETRYYTAERGDVLIPSERIVSLTTLKTDADGDRTYEDSWTVDTDFDLLPYNAVLDGIPYRSIEITPNGNYRFPQTPKGVELVGKFGWSAAPTGIVEACFLAASRLKARKNTPLGVSGAAATGQLVLIVKTMKADPDIMEQLMPYILRY